MKDKGDKVTTIKDHPDINDMLSFFINKEFKETETAEE